MAVVKKSSTRVASKSKSTSETVDKKSKVAVSSARKGARKFEPLITRHRPKKFSDLIGMDSIAKSLSTAMAIGDIPNGFLLLGTTGCGKTTLARIIARTAMCETMTACGTCSSCVMAEENIDQHVDYTEINCGVEGKVDEIRNMLAMSRNAPMVGSMRVIVLDEVHRLSGASAEAILKPLEEPSPRTLFILATTEANAIKDTVKNRCLTIRVNPLNSEVLGDYLAEISREEVEDSIPIEDWATLTQEVAEMSGGLIRTSLSYLDQILKLHRSGEGGSIQDFLERVREDILNNVDADVLAAHKILLGILTGNPKIVGNMLASHADFVSLSRNMVSITQYLLDSAYEARGSNVYHIPHFRDAADAMNVKFSERKVSARAKLKALTILAMGVTDLHGRIMTFAVPERALINAHALRMLDEIRQYTQKPKD